ncbi:EAL domain-containing protein [Paenibacillus hamazuiensis]|uniref:EAL domain-containing protein n=1 Tax=Paenibacillus hamazuiensis TaxID=2936508 RepID=UPI00200BCA64|nr:EAL domain-containing protein [Paenibacillus hamazuiensis]
MLAGGVIPAGQEVQPFFQPIVSMQTQRVIGYETLGRHIVGNEIRSLGPFFQDPNISDETHLGIDRILRERAIERMSAEKNGAWLFINLKPSWIYRVYRETGMLPTLQFIDKHGMDPARIVIEVTEEEFQGRLEELTQIIEVYRQRGCTIAIDDIGSGSSNYERIASIRPKILKIDLKILKKSATHDGYKALLDSFSILSSQMGASLLVEGVETKQDLHNALKAGARYVQGFLFSPAVPELLPDSAFEDMLKQEIKLYTEQQLHRYRSLFSVQESLNDLITAEAMIGGAEDADALIRSLLGRVADNVVRMYICREDGRQISSNFSRTEECGWEVDEKFRGANWIWRPYFIPNVLRMSVQGQGHLSQVYIDLDSSRPMQTYSCPLNRDHYLFLDLFV